MRPSKKAQYIVTINASYIRRLYEQQTGDKKLTQSQLITEVIKDIDDFINGKVKWIARFLMPDGSLSYTITPLVKYNLQERRKAKRRRR